MENKQKTVVPSLSPGLVVACEHSVSLCSTMFVDSVYSIFAFLYHIPNYQFPYKPYSS